MKIVICCSMKYKNLIEETVKKLESIGITPIFPNLNHNQHNVTTNEDKKQLALAHYAAIDEADRVYFLTPEGYMGTSVKLELGYSIARNKPIYFSEPTNDISLDCYVREFISTDNLEKFLL